MRNVLMGACDSMRRVCGITLCERTDPARGLSEQMSPAGNARATRSTSSLSSNCWRAPTRLASKTARVRVYIDTGWPGHREPCTSDRICPGEKAAGVRLRIEISKHCIPKRHGWRGVAGSLIVKTGNSFPGTSAVASPSASARCASARPAKACRSAVLGISGHNGCLPRGVNEQSP